MISPTYKEKLVAIDERVSKLTEVSIEDIHSNSRIKNVIYAKFLAWYLARCFYIPYTVIGVAYNKDHTTVIHGVERVTLSKEWKDKADLIFQESFTDLPKY